MQRTWDTWQEHGCTLLADFHCWIQTLSFLPNRQILMSARRTLTSATPPKCALTQMEDTPAPAQKATGLSVDSVKVRVLSGTTPGEGTTQQAWPIRLRCIVLLGFWEMPSMSSEACVCSAPLASPYPSSPQPISLVSRYRWVSLWLLPAAVCQRARVVLLHLQPRFPAQPWQQDVLRWEQKRLNTHMHTYLHTHIQHFLAPLLACLCELTNPCCPSWHERSMCGYLSFILKWYNWKPILSVALTDNRITAGIQWYEWLYQYAVIKSNNMISNEFIMTHRGVQIFSGWLE